MPHGYCLSFLDLVGSDLRVNSLPQISTGHCSLRPVGHRGVPASWHLWGLWQQQKSPPPWVELSCGGCLHNLGSISAPPSQVSGMGGVGF